MTLVIKKKKIISMTLHTKGNKDYIIQLSSCSYDVEHLELFLKVINYIIVQLESLNKNIRIDGRIDVTNST
jgi:hypothetical protein